MLILSRKLGETIVIGDDIRVTVLGIKHGVVRIGIAAPKDVPVHRQSVYDKIKEESKDGL